MFKGSVANIAALQALNSSVLVDSAVFFVKDAGEVKGATYMFHPGSEVPAFGNLVINVPTGRWIRMGHLVHETTNPPYGTTPPLKHIEWIATLANPNRVVRWRSVGTASVSDWMPVGDGYVNMTGSPSGVLTPDYLGQIVISSDQGQAYIATGSDNLSWKTMIYS